MIINALVKWRQLRAGLCVVTHSPRRARRFTFMTATRGLRLRTLCICTALDITANQNRRWYTVLNTCAPDGQCPRMLDNSRLITPPLHDTNETASWPAPLHTHRS
eukprot:TRINITY_DN9389_c0_g1_i1.p2 TRINITY_DN9389_c0_g1~~TRINITY_DN9389_c0_g1_i1.p2  ORF type:complete len:105 (-),score=9.11 TRINITY_DN9389_c0_g1_i1:82-396(-)